MKRKVITLVVTVVASMTLMSGSASAEDLTEKLIGCNGYVPIACPGPLPW